MPKQYVLFGRLMPPITTRRITILLSAVSIFAVFSIIFTLPSAVPTGPSLSKFADHKFSLPQLTDSSKWKQTWNKGWNTISPFQPKAHAPPRQKDDSHGGSSWFADWKWLSTPFSSSFTLDESRSLLPPLHERPPIYCYYDTTVQRSAADKEAESALLLTWRRAWWAQGFRPVILSAGEAVGNPRYEELQRLQTTQAAKTDIMRWLAWENMGGGLMAQYLLLPMGSRDDPLLSFLRRGEYPNLTRWKGLSDGLFAGSKADVATAIKLVLGNTDLASAKSFLEAIPKDAAKVADANDEGDDTKKKTKDYPFTVDTTTAPLAFYDAKTVATKYSQVADEIAKSRAVGMRKLNNLINGHLQIAWQNLFSNGIAVLKPVPKHTTHMIEPALDLAHRLAQCSETPMSATCPPNLPKCEPCVARQRMRVHTPPTYRNDTKLFTIGTVPHPYTYQLLAYSKGVMDVKWIRRQSKRDAWLFDITKELLGTGISGAPRVLQFKRAVASDYGISHNLWLAAEQPIQEDIDWILGFHVAEMGKGLDTGHSPTPVPGPERLPPPKHDKDDGPVATKEDLAREKTLMERGRQIGLGKEKKNHNMRDIMEAWNLADAEAWKFARAYLARAHVERITWEKEEAKYAGGAGTEKNRRDGFWS